MRLPEIRIHRDPPSMQAESERELVDAIIDAYVRWREEAESVERAYRAWRTAAERDEARAFSAYTAAVDLEEYAAACYAAAIADYRWARRESGLRTPRRKS